MSSGAGMSSLRKGLLSLVGLRQRDRSEFFPLDGPSAVHADLAVGRSAQSWYYRAEPPTTAPVTGQLAGYYGHLPSDLGPYGRTHTPKPETIFVVARNDQSRAAVVVR